MSFVQGRKLSRMTILEAVAAVLFEPQRFDATARRLMSIALEQIAHQAIKSEVTEHGSNLEEARRHRFDQILSAFEETMFGEEKEAAEKEAAEKEAAEKEAAEKEAAKQKAEAWARARDEAVRIFVAEADNMGWKVDAVALNEAVNEIKQHGTQSMTRRARLFELLGETPRGLWSPRTGEGRKAARLKGAVSTFAPRREPGLANVIRSVEAGGWPNPDEQSGGVVLDLDATLASIVAMSQRLGDGSIEEQDRLLFALDCAYRSFESRVNGGAAYTHGPVLWLEVVERSGRLVVDLAASLARRENWALWQLARGGRKTLRHTDGTWNEVIVPREGVERPSRYSYTRFRIDENTQPSDVALLAWQLVDARLAFLGRSTLEALDAGAEIDPLQLQARASWLRWRLRRLRRLRRLLRGPYSGRRHPPVPDEFKNVLPFWYARRGQGPGRLKDQVRVLAAVPESQRRALVREIAERFAKVHERLEKRWNDAINRPSEPTG